MRIDPRFVFAAALVVAPTGPVPAQVHLEWKDMNPNRSSYDDYDPATGSGRVNGLAQSATGQDVYAASEAGGIYKSSDRGQTWGYLPAHRPTVTWDVAVDPSNSSRVYATSWYDGRVASLAGISVSSDAGATWVRPASSAPPAGFCDGEDRRDNPSAFGIAIDPSNSNHVFVGTNCGVAISSDAGVTWHFVDPTPANKADDVWDVIVHHGGIVDICGDDGHHRSTDGGASWTTSSTLPAGICSLAVSPDEDYVLLSVVGTTIRESDNAGASWLTVITNPQPQGRVPFVAVNDRTGSSFDLWFGDVRLDRTTCSTPASPGIGGTARCPTNNWSGSFTRTGCIAANACTAHDDAGAILFDPQVSVDACPLLFSTDGGVFWNTVTTSPNCHSPIFDQPAVTLHTLRLFSMAGVDEPGGTPEDLYFGTQDDGVFANITAGDPLTTFLNQRLGDIFDMVANPTRVVFGQCCPPYLVIADPNIVNRRLAANLPSGYVPNARYPDALAAFPTGYALATSSGVYVTSNIETSPVVWTQIGASSSPASIRNLWIGVSAGVPTFYVQTGMPYTPSSIFKFIGTGTGSWVAVNPPGGNGSFGVFTVDGTNPDRIFASHLRASADPAMIRSNDGGATWLAVPQLDNLMTGGGLFRYRNTRGPFAFGGAMRLVGDAMPTLVAFDTVDRNVLIAGGAESGIFVSIDDGTHWELVSDPINPVTSGVPHLPRPVFAYFDHESGEVPDPANPIVTVFVGTDGRGVWKLTRSGLPLPPPDDDDEPASSAGSLGHVCHGSIKVCLEAVLGPQRIVLNCATDPKHCRFVDLFDKNCTIKFGCPGCQRGFCPPFYHLYLEDYDPRTWDVALFSRNGERVPHQVIRNSTGVVVSFRPSRQLYREGRVGDYALVFAMKRGGKPGKYTFRTHLERADCPYRSTAPKR